MGKIKTMKKCSKCGQEKEYTEFHRDKRYSDGYFSYCKQCANEYSKIWSKNESRKEYLREYQRKRRKDPEYRKRNNAQILKSKKSDPLYSEKKKAYESARRARINNSINNFTHKEWLDLIEKYGEICLSCKEKKKLTPDHIIPLVLGGSNSIDNIQPLCINCNSSKRTKIIDYRGDINVKIFTNN